MTILLDDLMGDDYLPEIETVQDREARLMAEPHGENPDDYRQEEYDLKHTPVMGHWGDGGGDE